LAVNHTDKIDMLRLLEDWQRAKSRFADRAVSAILWVAAIGAIILLTACAHHPVKIETVEVKVPVAMHPITPAQVPQPPAPLPPRPANLSSAADVLLGQVCRLEAYVIRVDPLLRVSAGLPPASVPAFPECEH
jgi:hypothetical protein